MKLKKQSWYILTSLVAKEFGYNIYPTDRRTNNSNKSYVRERLLDAGATQYMLYMQSYRQYITTVQDHRTHPSHILKSTMFSALFFGHLNNICMYMSFVHICDIKSSTT
ncbi:unnamed protein product [Brassica rapa]|uniref:Uncharacterized protein n=2 Tax=Brassica TaxID=3705 RepID=A0A8D9MIK9_BRACM|nr:unnamed protein product [Brassica napus]CAG7911532.1 unnamed protein product [Brassica rapa]